MKIRKPRRVVKRNPMAAELARNTLYRTRVLPSAEENAQKNDAWNRSAKHKNSINDYEDEDEWEWCDDYE